MSRVVHRHSHCIDIRRNPSFEDPRSCCYPLIRMPYTVEATYHFPTAHFTLVQDGCSPLRSLLHPDASDSGIGCLIVLGGCASTGPLLSCFKWLHSCVAYMRIDFYALIFFNRFLEKESRLTATGLSARAADLGGAGTLGPWPRGARGDFTS